MNANIQNISESPLFIYLCSRWAALSLSEKGEESPDRAEQGSVEITAGGNLRQIVTEKNRLEKGKGENAG